MSIGAAVGIDLNRTGTLVDLTEVTERAQWAYGRFGGVHAHRAGSCRVTLTAPEGAELPIPSAALARPQALAGAMVRVTAVDPDGAHVPGLAWTGWVDEVSTTVREGVQTVEITSVDALGWLAGRRVELPDTTPAELTGARIDRILTAAGWPAGHRDIDAGVTMCAALTEPLAGDALALAAETADTDPGRLVSSREITEAVTFLAADNEGAVPGSRPIIVTDSPGPGGGGGAPLVHWAEHPQARDDSELMYTEVVYEASDGVTRSLRNVTASEEVGVWTLYRRLHATPAVAGKTVGVLLAGLSVPRTTVRAARVALHAEESTGSALDAAAQTIGNQVQAWVRRKGRPEVVVGMIDGIACDIAPLHPPSGRVQWTLEWDLFPLGVYTAEGFSFLPPDDVPDLPVHVARHVQFAPATGATTPVTYSSSQPPPGMAWDSRLLAIAGTPTALGSTPVTVTAETTVPDPEAPDGLGAAEVVLRATADVTLNVVSMLEFGFGDLAVLVVVQGGAPAEWALPAPTGGVTPRVWTLTVDGAAAEMADAGGAEVTLKLTPPAAGTLPNTLDAALTASVTDTHSTAEATVPVRVRVPVAVAAGAALPDATAALPYAALMALAPTGGTGAYRFETALTGAGSGGLTAGTTADSQGRVALTGTPTQAGGVTAVVTCIDTGDENNRATATYTLTVAAPVTLTLPSVIELPLWAPGQTVSFALPAATTNLATVVYSLTGLPSGLAFAPATRTISGTAPAAGTYRWAYRAAGGPVTASSTVVANVGFGGRPLNDTGVEDIDELLDFPPEDCGTDQDVLCIDWPESR